MNDWKDSKASSVVEYLGLLEQAAMKSLSTRSIMSESITLPSLPAKNWQNHTTVGEFLIHLLETRYGSTPLSWEFP